MRHSMTLSLSAAHFLARQRPRCTYESVGQATGCPLLPHPNPLRSGRIDAHARKCDAPMRHRAGRISLRRCLECPNCGTVIEAEEEVETLVEVFLSFGRVC